MCEKHIVILGGDCAAEAELAREFPELFAWYSRNAAARPNSCESWERILHASRNCEPILRDIRSRGLRLLRLNQSTPLLTDRRPIYQCVIEWLPKIEDPLTMSLCLGRLLEPEARILLKRNRELLLSVAREWNARLREGDRERVLETLAQCLMRAVRERDIPEILSWVNDAGFPAEVRASYIYDLQRFAKKPGPARDALLALLNDQTVGGSAMWAISGALKSDALPHLRLIEQSSPDDSLRQIAAAAARKVEARSSRVRHPKNSPTMLPQGHQVSSAEFDTAIFPQLLSRLEQDLNGQMESGVRDQLFVMAIRLRRGRGDFAIVPVRLPDGALTTIGIGVCAEDEDVIAVELHFAPKFEAAVTEALRYIMERSGDVEAASGGDPGSPADAG